jgi:hypothetical protein
MLGRYAPAVVHGPGGGASRCRGPGGQLAEGQLAEDSARCAADTGAERPYAWLSGSVTLDLVANEWVRLYVGAGADTGSMTTYHTTFGLLLKRAVGVELRTGPDQLVVGAAVLF